MFRPKHNFCILFVFILSLLFSTATYANPAFDFGLPLFGYEEIRFETSKSPEFNLRFLKKYISEHQGSLLHQLHAISRWFHLIKLSDKPKQKQLKEISREWFSTADIKEVSKEERLREIYFQGLLLSLEDDANNSDDEKFENLLLDSEDLLSQTPEYHIIKGLIFHLLRNRPNDYFGLMKPEEDLKKALVLLPQDPHYYFVAGQAFRFLGTNDSSLFLSIASYEKAASLQPRNPKLQNTLLGIYMGLHEDFQARQKPEPFWLEEAVYKKILTLSPDNPYALNNLGYLYAEYGVNSQLSQDLCQKAVNLSPDNPGFRDSLGWASFKNRDFITSEQELKKSLAMRSNVYEPNYHIATLYYATGQLEKAEKYYRQALKIKPDSSETLNNLAYLLAEQNKDIDEAKEMSKIAVKLEPGNASYLDTLGWLYYRQGDLDQALHQLIKASHLAPGQGEILMHIGVVKLEQGNFDHAFTYLKEAWKSDPNLKETENALYLALRLKAYYQALEEYHKLLKDKADKNRICNILTSIARLYQEEHQYDKSIEFTKICAEIRNGTRSLAKPVFDFYRIEKKSKETTAVESKEHRDQIPTEDKSEVEDPARTIVEANKEDLEVLPESCGFPLVISLGPDFFKYAGSFVPGLEQFETTSVSFFIKRIFRPSKGIAFRIESENSTGTTLLILARDYFTQLGFKANETNDIDRLDFKIGRKNILAIAENNSLYIFSDLAPSKAKLENLNQICPHRFRTIGSIFYDWKALEARIPGVLKAFVKNPLEPFEKAYSRYSWKNKTLNEFSILSTGKNEDASFMRDFARRLLDLKIQTKKLGIEATIRIRQEKEHFYISIDLEGLKKFFDRYKLPAFLDNAARKLIKNRLDSYSCLISRMFYTSDTVKICPQNGQIRIDSGSGIIECTAHSNLPAIPFFIDDHQACRFYRQRVEAIIKEKYPDGNYFDENLLNDIIKEYNIPQCPTSGNWELGKNGKINCSDHED